MNIRGTRVWISGGTRVWISGVRWYEYLGYAGMNIRGYEGMNIRGKMVWISGVRGYKYQGVRGYEYPGYEGMNIRGTRVCISGVRRYEYPNTRHHYTCHQTLYYDVPIPPHLSLNPILWRPHPTTPVCTSAHLKGVIASISSKLPNQGIMQHGSRTDIIKFRYNTCLYVIYITNKYTCKED